VLLAPSRSGILNTIDSSYFPPKRKILMDLRFLTILIIRRMEILKVLILIQNKYRRPFLPKKVLYDLRSTLGYQAARRPRAHVLRRLLHGATRESAITFLTILPEDEGFQSAAYRIPPLEMWGRMRKYKKKERTTRVAVFSCI
jgi:hypothetical protein